MEADMLPEDRGRPLRSWTLCCWVKVPGTESH